MKKILMMLTVLATTGCSWTRVPPLHAGTGELPIDVGNISTQACSIHLLGFIGSFGDNAIGKAAQSVGISTITYYEKKYNYYILWGESCNIVYGNNHAIQKPSYSVNYNRWTR